MTDTAPAPPGSEFYAPQARFVDVREPGKLIDAVVNADLVSVRVTQVHSDVSQVQLTLDNQRHADGRPVYPPWKYNGLSLLEFGQRLRVDFRYGADPAAWAPMILARVTDVRFTFPASGGAQVQVQGEDLLSLLKRKDTRDKRYRDQHERDIARDVLARAGLTLPIASPLGTHPVFTETLRSVTHQKSQTYLQFLQTLAEPIDYEIFVDHADPTNPESPIELHFEPARSLTLRGVVDLGWGKNLVEFNPVFKVWEQFTQATARGRHPRQRSQIEESAAADAIEADLHAEPGQPAPIHAIAARQRFFAVDGASGADNPEPVDVSNLDRTRARLKAASVLRKRARQFLTAEAQTIGFPRLRPGIHVNVKNMYAPFDGLYYVTKAVHSLDAGGYKTQISLRRPGMLPPEGYPAEAARRRQGGATP